MIGPTALALMTGTSPEGPQRTRALGVNGALLSLGFVIGTIGGGLITSGLNWRWTMLPARTAAAAAPQDGQVGHDGRAGNLRDVRRRGPGRGQFRGQDDQRPGDGGDRRHRPDRAGRRHRRHGVPAGPGRPGPAAGDVGRHGVRARPDGGGRRHDHHVRSGGDRPGGGGKPRPDAHLRRRRPPAPPRPGRVTRP
ncbi:hypothetical protein [Nonomuraea sp. NPDC005692]|uniref:hypothetical protein n=1 Tax=Nonomuraea sp. NPDC005692 TaxID=3157168 RepID=UPI0033C9002F